MRVKREEVVHQARSWIGNPDREFDVVSEEAGNEGWWEGVYACVVAQVRS